MDTIPRMLLAWSVHFNPRTRRLDVLVAVVRFGAVGMMILS